MNESKLNIKIGNLEFAGEGNQDWLSGQFDKFLSQLPLLNQKCEEHSQSSVYKSEDSTKKEMTPDTAVAAKALGAFLRDNNAVTNQVKKFLATAVWLESKGVNRVKTSEITKALKDNNQTRLGNPSKCLGDNVSKGLCERDGKEFFVTEDGKASLAT
jgi:hypothetical protein